MPCAALMASSARKDSRTSPEGAISHHQVTYSLGQLRLVGMVLLVGVASRILAWLLALIFPAGQEAGPLDRLAHLTSLSNWLLLLPLGVSLYLLGGGRQRLPREFALLDLVHNSLVPLAVGCLVVLPAFTLHDVGSLNQQGLVQLQKLEQVQTKQNLLVDQARKAGNAATVVQLAKGAGLSLPAMAGEPASLASWRLERLLEQQRQKELQNDTLLRLSPYEQELMSKRRSLTTVLLQLITGAGLLLLQRQSKSQIQRHGLKPHLFFRVDPVRGGRK